MGNEKPGNELPGYFQPVPLGRKGAEEPKLPEPCGMAVSCTWERTLFLAKFHFAQIEGCVDGSDGGQDVAT